jgi:hypothetical protein
MSETKDENDNHFGWLLGQLRRGRAMDDASAQLRDLVEAVRNTGKAGKLTLTLTVAPASKGDSDMLTVLDNCAAKQPELDRAASLFFATDGGGLQRNDPRQTEFPADVFRQGKKQEGEERKAKES